MTNYLFPPTEPRSLAVIGEEGRYPVNRIFCVGRNYEDHAKEMGAEVDREAPFYFTKGVHAVFPSGGVLRYPPGTEDFHYETELVVAIGAPAFRLPKEKAASVIFGYGIGLDMTRRDLQARSKERRQPWDTAKDVEESAVLSSLTRQSDMAPIAAQRIWLEVNGQTRQDSDLSKMVWSIPEIIQDLSSLYRLAPGDLIMTGTPAGVGAVKAGDKLLARIDGLSDLSVTIGESR